MIKSETKEKYGMSCAEAIRKGYIMQATRWSQAKNDIVNAGWECRLTGQNYPTQSEAVEAHFACVAEEQAKHDALAQSAPEFPGFVSSALDGTEQGTRKAIRRLRNASADGELSSDYTEEQIDALFAKLKAMLPGFRAA